MSDYYEGQDIWERFGPPVREKVIVEDRVFLICRPERSDRLLAQPASRSATGDYIPYWADLWPAARMLAKVILRETWAPGQEALEIGCGLGLPGITALSMGVRVIFSDHDPYALRAAEDNARLNGFTNFGTRLLDWRQPPANLKAPLVLGSDLIYEVSNVEPLVSFLKQILAPGGLCLLTDEDRVPAQMLRNTLAAQRLEFTTQTVRAGEPGGRRLKGTLYRIRG